MTSTSFRELAEIVRLERGRHRTPQDGVCTMELVAWMAGERHTDQPQSVSPRIATFVRAFNDALDGAERQRLGPLAARMIGTRTTLEGERIRGQLLWEWTIGTAVPAWCRAAGRDDIAASVRHGRGAALPEATAALDVFGHADVRPLDDDRINAVVTEALAVSGLTGACLAGGDVADDLSGSRARRPWHAARVLARAAAWRVAERDPHAALGVAGGPLTALVEELRDSAFALLDRLIAVTEVPAPPPPPLAVWAADEVAAAAWAPPPPPPPVPAAP